MDANEQRSVVASVCLEHSATIYAAVCSVSEGFQPDLLEAIYRACFRLHSSTTGAAQQSPPPQAAPGPFDPGPQPPPPPVVQPPVMQSPPVAQPSPPQPQPVMQGPPCPNCQTPMSMTNDYAAKKARNLSQGKKAPPMWRCPMGTWDPATKQAMGCQGVGWEVAA